MTIIVATDLNGAIGKDGKMPWHLPEDLKHFRDTTEGGTVIMGRKTWDSLPDEHRPLKGRKNVVITRNISRIKGQGCDAWDSLEPALRRHPDAFVIGGGEIYAQAIPFADKMIISVVNQAIEGADTFFMFNARKWRNTKRDYKTGFRVDTWERRERKT